jgi:hypothetical protein
MTIEVEREMDGIYYYVSVAVSLAGDDIDARVAEDVPELEITGYERSTGQAIHEATSALAFAQGDEIDLDEREITRALFALHEESVRQAGKTPRLAVPQLRSSTLNFPLSTIE